MSKKNEKLISHGDIPEWTVSAVNSLLAGLKTVDELTYFHCLRVGQYSAKLAQSAGLTPYQQKLAELSGALHDVGKMGIDKNIIHKPARLNESEYVAMKSHPVMSEKIVQPLAADKNEFFTNLLPAVRNHHERLDGQGYPDKLQGDDIPILSRIILIVDTLDAMSMDRSYRKGLPLHVVYQELQKYAGTQFDPHLVKIFLESHRFWAPQIDPESLENSMLKKVA